jgi:hypothetical protein
MVYKALFNTVVKFQIENWLQKFGHLAITFRNSPNNRVLAWVTIVDFYHTCKVKCSVLAAAGVDSILQAKKSARESCVPIKLPLTGELEKMPKRPGVLTIFLGVMFSSNSLMYSNSPSPLKSVYYVYL